MPCNGASVLIDASPTAASVLAIPSLHEREAVAARAVLVLHDRPAIGGHGERPSVSLLGDREHELERVLALDQRLAVFVEHDAA